MIAAVAFALFVQKGQNGIECVSVDPSGPAYKAGIRERDVMLEFDGKPVRSPEDLRYVVLNCFRGGRIAARMRHGSILIDAKDLGEWPRGSARLKALFEPEIAPEIKPLRTKAMDLEKENKLAEASVAYRELADKAKEKGDWMNYARSIAKTAYFDDALHPVIEWVPKEQIERDREVLVERGKWIEEARKAAAVSGDPAVDRVIRTALHEACYGLGGNYNNRSLGQPALANYGMLLASLEEMGWTVAAATIRYGSNHFVQNFGRVGYNRDSMIAAIKVLEPLPVSRRSIEQMYLARAYYQIGLDGSAFDGDYTDGVLAARKAVQMAKDLGIRSDEAIGWWDLGIAAFNHGNDALALEAFHNARAIVGDPAFVPNQWRDNGHIIASIYANARAFEGFVHARRFAFDDAIAAARESKELVRPEWVKKYDEFFFKDRKDWWIGFPMGTLGYILASSGQVSEGVAEVASIPKGIRSHGNFGPANSMSEATMMIAESRLPAGTVDLTKSYWSRRDGGSAHGLETLFEALVRYRCRAVIYAKMRKRKEALEDLRLGRQLIDRYRPSSHDRAELALDEARVYDEIGTPLESTAAWRRAAVAYRAESAAALGESGRQYAGSLLAAAGNGWVGAAARQNDAGQALEAFESTRAASLMNATVAQDEGAFAPIQEALKALDEVRLRHGDAVGSLEYFKLRLKDNRLPAADRDEFEKGLKKAEAEADETQAEAEKKELAVQQGFTEAQAKLKVPAPDPQGAIDRLPADAGFVGYSINEKNVVLLAVRRGQAPLVRTLPLDPARLAKIVYAHRDLLTDRHSALKAVDASGFNLGNALLPRAARTYLKGCKRLVIAPDGPLWELSFASLRLAVPAVAVKGAKKAAAAPAYLGAQWPLQYAQSLAVYTDDRRPKSKNVEALVVGDPAFSAEEAKGDAERGALWGAGKPPVRLPATKAEADAVAGVYGAKPLIGADATEAAVRKAIEKARIVHLATHGYFHPTVPGASGVLLAPGADGAGRADDGALQAAEILRGLRLDADLVVLSACETARGRYLQGEGVIGLTRSLQVACARTICASQWRVADATTAKLMAAFHAKIAKGQPVDEALRASMVELMKTNKHPYYWSPFLLVGRAART